MEPAGGVQVQATERDGNQHFREYLHDLKNCGQLASEEEALEMEKAFLHWTDQDIRPDEAAVAVPDAAAVAVPDAVPPTGANLLSLPLDVLVMIVDRCSFATDAARLARCCRLLSRAFDRSVFGKTLSQAQSLHGMISRETGNDNASYLVWFVGKIFKYHRHKLCHSQPVLKMRATLRRETLEVATLYSSEDDRLSPEILAPLCDALELVRAKRRRKHFSVKWSIGNNFFKTRVPAKDDGSVCTAWSSTPCYNHLYWFDFDEKSPETTDETDLHAGSHFLEHVRERLLVVPAAASDGNNKHQQEKRLSLQNVWDFVQYCEMAVGILTDKYSVVLTRGSDIDIVFGIPMDDLFTDAVEEATADESSF